MCFKTIKNIAFMSNMDVSSYVIWTIMFITRISSAVFNQFTPSYHQKWKASKSTEISFRIERLFILGGLRTKWYRHDFTENAAARPIEIPSFSTCDQNDNFKESKRAMVFGWIEAFNTSKIARAPKWHI